MRKITIATALAVIATGMAASAFGLLVATRTIFNIGNVKAIGVGVYWDSGCANEVSSIDWGNLLPDETKEVTVYVKNEGSVVMTLSMTTDDWNPESASTYITLSWNRENHVLNSGSAVQAVLTLSVSSSIGEITNFSFDVIITGTENT